LRKFKICVSPLVNRYQGLLINACQVAVWTVIFMKRFTDRKGDTTKEDHATSEHKVTANVEPYLSAGK